jgi:hypothetical protein
LLSRAGKHVTAAMSSAAALTFDKHGEPAAVMQLSEVQLPNLGDTDVHLQMLAVSHSLAMTLAALHGLQGRAGHGSCSAVG